MGEYKLNGVIASTAVTARSAECPMVPKLHRVIASTIPTLPKSVSYLLLSQLHVFLEEVVHEVSLQTSWPECPG